MKHRTFPSPFGDLHIMEENGEISALGWGVAPREDETVLLTRACEQLREYCAGTRQSFDLPLNIGRTDFQRAVGQSMLDIPFGQTRTYGEIAVALGVPAQAVGQACGANPIPIIIPCHRVMGAKGMTGFSGGTGIETKVALLRHEGGVLI